MTDRNDRHDRYDQLEGKVDEIAKGVLAIERLLYTEPEASPLGRALLKVANENRRLIDDHWEAFETFRKDDFAPIDDWWLKSRGVWQGVLGLAVILGIVATFFGLASYFN